MTLSIIIYALFTIATPVYKLEIPRIVPILLDQNLCNLVQKLKTQTLPNLVQIVNQTKFIKYIFPIQTEPSKYTIQTKSSSKHKRNQT